MPTLRAWLADAPFSIALSSGFFGFFAHAGVMCVLEDEGLLPTHLAGSSAGALVAGLWASGVDARVIGEELMGLERAHFWDPGFGAGLLRGALFRKLLEDILPVTTFEETRARLAVSVFDVLSRTTRVERQGLLAPAIHASCAVPLMFHPVMLRGRPCVDGGVADRPGIAGLPRGGRVLFHHLASKSPWRFAVPLPHEREEFTTLVLEGLPRVGPFRMHEGARAFAHAKERTRRALDTMVAPRMLV